MFSVLAYCAVLRNPQLPRAPFIRTVVVSRQSSRMTFWLHRHRQLNNYADIIWTIKRFLNLISLSVQLNK